MEVKESGKLICYGCMNKLESEGRCPVCGFDLNTYEGGAYHLVPGSLLNGRYVVGRVLGEGSSCIIYIGWDSSLEIKVVLKEYYPFGLVTRKQHEEGGRKTSVCSDGREKEYALGLKAFVDETRQLAKFRNNPEIVGVSDFFEENGTAYMVMDYVDGIPLSGYIWEKAEGNQAEVGEKTGQVENHANFQAVQKKGIAPFSSGNKGIKKIGVALLACLAAGIIGLGFWLASDGKEKGDAPKETPEATATISPQEQQYGQANVYREQGDYEKASAIYRELAEYKDCQDRYKETMYLYAAQLGSKGDYQKAAQIYGAIPDYGDAKIKRVECIYQQALGLYRNGKPQNALKLLKEISTYKKAATLKKKCNKIISQKKSYSKAKKLYDAGKYEKCRVLLKKISSYKPAGKLLKKAEKKIRNMPPDAPDIGEFYDSTNYSVEGDGTMWTVKWNPVKGASGYQYYCVQSDSVSEPYYEEQDTTNCYYEVGASDQIAVEFKVRAYKYINGTKKYGDWSRTVYCYMN